MTGKRKQVPRSEKEHLSVMREDLIIIDEESWEKAQKRWIELEGTLPVRKENSNIKQKSYIHGNPTHLLTGLMKCQKCGGAIVLISGKGSGYYGCYNTKRKTCDNNLLVPRQRIEKAIISELKEKILTAENLEYVYKNLEKLIAKGLNETPELIKKKKSQYEKVMIEIQNYLNFIKSGNFSKAVSGALNEAEKKGENLKQEMGSLEFQRQNTFKSPPKEWINHRLDRFHETLNKNTTSSALALKEVLGPIRLEPIMDRDEDFYGIMEDSFGGAKTNENGDSPLKGQSPFSYKFKPYYVAHTKIQTLALLDDRYKGSNWLHWRRRKDSNPRGSCDPNGFRDRPIQPLWHSSEYIITLSLRFNPPEAD